MHTCFRGAQSYSAVRHSLGRSQENWSASEHFMNSSEMQWILIKTLFLKQPVKY